MPIKHNNIFSTYIFNELTFFKFKNLTGVKTLLRLCAFQTYGYSLHAALLK
jgi:hypothetical protein